MESIKLSKYLKPASNSKNENETLLFEVSPLLVER